MKKKIKKNHIQLRLKRRVIYKMSHQIQLIRASVVAKISELGEIEPDVAGVICNYALNDLRIQIKKTEDCGHANWRDCEEVHNGDCSLLESIYSVMFYDVNGSIRYEMEEQTMNSLESELEFNIMNMTCVHCSTRYDGDYDGEFCC
jgi:hypothetical protein